jgi:hypothetical protein
MRSLSCRRKATWWQKPRAFRSDPLGKALAPRGVYLRVDNSAPTRDLHLRAVHGLPAGRNSTDRQRSIETQSRSFKACFWIASFCRRLIAVFASALCNGTMFAGARSSSRSACAAASWGFAGRSFQCSLRTPRTRFAVQRPKRNGPAYVPAGTPRHAIWRCRACGSGGSSRPGE